MVKAALECFAAISALHYAKSAQFLEYISNILPSSLSGIARKKILQIVETRVKAQTPPRLKADGSLIYGLELSDSSNLGIILGALAKVKPQ